MKRKVISICLMVALVTLSVFTLAACGTNQSTITDGNGSENFSQNLASYARRVVGPNQSRLSREESRVSRYGRNRRYGYA